MTASLFSRRSFLYSWVAFLVFASTGFADVLMSGRDPRRVEVNFLTAVIDHRFGGGKLTELSAGRAIHPELKALCDEVKTAQSAEIDKMQGWLLSWYGVAHQPELD